MSIFSVKAGDLVGFSSYSFVDVIINIATRGIPFYHISHVGIVANDTVPVIFESSRGIKEPCIIQNKRVTGVQAHLLTQRVKSYKGKVWLFPLARELNTAQKVLLQDYLESQIGVQYDTLGAFRSRDLSLLEKIIFRKADLHSLFCSEYCAEAYKRIGIFGENLDAGSLNPNKLTRICRKLGFNLSGIPLRLVA